MPGCGCSRRWGGAVTDAGMPPTGARAARSDSYGAARTGLCGDTTTMSDAGRLPWLFGLAVIAALAFSMWGLLLWGVYALVGCVA